MTAKEFTAALPSFTCVGQEFLDRMAKGARKLSSAARTAVIEELTKGQQRKDALMAEATRQLKDCDHCLKREVRTMRESAEHSEEQKSLPSFDA